uniref:Uncharacterized protein n=1 Tax=Kalanchoe fedtschenkoi TaxID=63787 RepID=A0A7N0UZV1_KALFE
MTAQVVKVKRDKIAPCMTCPLCNKLFKEATTISLCLHTSATMVFASFFPTKLSPLFATSSIAFTAS